MRRVPVATLLALSLALLAVPSISGAAGSLTITQQSAMIRQSLKAKPLPKVLTPRLATALRETATNDSLNSYLGRLRLSACDPLRDLKKARELVSCHFGSRTSKNVVVLFGDSSTFAWAEALDGPFKAQGLRLELLEFSSCSSPALEANEQAFSDRWQYCNEWHARMPEFVAKLKPIAIISSSAAYQSPTTDREWIDAYAQTFDDLAPQGEVRILIGTTPWLSSSAPSCLALNTSDVNRCTFKYSPKSPYAKILRRDEAVARAAQATLVPAVDLLCVNQRCPIVIQGHIVYRDDHHIYESYARVIGPLISAKLNLPR
jgi:hypothetical protein